MSKKQTKEINSLTKEQEAMIPIYQEKYLEIGLSTTRCDRVKAEEAICKSYEYLKLSKPEFIWVDSPEKGIRLAAQYAKGSTDVTAEEIAAQADMASYGSFESFWVSFYAFITEQFDIEHDNLIETAKDIVKNCGIYWSFEGLVIISEKPKAIHMVDKKLHNPNGLALEYVDGTGLFAIDGKVYSSMLDMTLAEHLEKNA